MFDTIAGLPLHALVVHGVVVLLPLAAVTTILLAFRPAWSRRAGWLVVAADAAVTVMAFVAMQSGKQLRSRIGDIPAVHRHAALGQVLPYTALALLVAALVVVYLRSRRPSLARVSQVLAAVAALVACWYTFLTGDTGARAVWGEVIKNT